MILPVLAGAEYLIAAMQHPGSSPSFLACTLGAASIALLLGCAASPEEGDLPEGQWRAGWSVQPHGALSGAVYTPTASGVIGSGRALLVVLHGCAQTYGNLQTYGSWVDTAEQYGMVVSLPGVAGGGVYFGCWDYYGSNHSRQANDAADLLGHVDALLDDPALGIDPDQVYIAGLSSGGGMAMVMGCLAPDVFAGVGIAAGPTVGTTAYQAGSVGTDANTARTTCQNLAGAASGHFDTQLAAVISGTNDYTVAQGYAGINAQVFGDLYAAARGLPGLTSAPLDVTALEGHQPAGTGSLRSDEIGPRVALISAQGMGHAWPAGTGPGSEISFVARQGVDFAALLAEMFTENNRRVDVGAGDGGGEGDGGGTTGAGDDAGESTGGESTGGESTGGGGDAGDAGGDAGDAGDAGGDGDGGSSTGGGDTGGGAPCEPWVATSTTTITGHFSHFGSHPGGYGAADITYVALYGMYGMNTPFTLYQGTNGAWYHDPANLPGAGCGG
jgi:poly(3-hydroxybutyrate) depolymerase